MKPETEQLLGTLEVLNEPLKDFDETLYGCYQTFFWDISAKGDFNIWNLMNFEEFIQPTTPETVIDSWLKEEQTHSIAPYDNYSLDEPDPETLLDDATKARRTEKYQSLLQLLNSNLQHLEGFTIGFYKFEYQRRYPCFCGLIGKTADESWIAILPTVPQRHSFPHWISHSPLEETAVQPIGENALRLQFSIEEILKELNTLKLAICYGAGYGYTYDYQLFCAVSSTKDSAFTQAMLEAKILELNKFEDFLPDYYQYNYTDDGRRKNQQILNKFFKQNFSIIRVYRLGLYDTDYTYVLGQVADTHWLGVTVSRYYQYNP